MRFILGWLILNQAIMVLLKVLKRKRKYIQLFALNYAKREQFDMQSVNLKITFRNGSS